MDWTSGMVIIAANDKDECREIFLKEFTCSEYKTEFDNAVFNVIESVGIDEPGIVDYVYGGS